MKLEFTEFGDVLVDGQPMPTSTATRRSIYARAAIQRHFPGFLAAWDRREERRLKRGPTHPRKGVA